jgi:hypothetical protein
MIIGAAKCATSSICDWLRVHPEIFFTEPKEPGFFSCDEVYAKGFDWYESLFSAAGSRPIRGEGSNRYTMAEVYPRTIDRLTRYTRDLRLVYVVRDPLPRIVSYWIQKRSHGGEEVHHDFNVAVRIQRPSLVDSTCYWQQLKPYREHYGDENILIAFYEDFARQPLDTMHAICRHIGADPSQLPDLPVHNNPSDGKQVVRPAVSRLRSFSLFRRSVKLIPAGLRAKIKTRLLWRRLEQPPRWDPAVREWVRTIVCPDATRLLSHCGRSCDIWPSIHMD